MVDLGSGVEAEGSGVTSWSQGGGKYTGGKHSRQIQKAPGAELSAKKLATLDHEIE